MNSFLFSPRARVQAILTLVCSLLLLAGCWLVEPQHVALDEATVAALEEKWNGNLEGMRAELEAIFGAQVRELRTIDGKLTAVLEPPLAEAAEEGGIGFIEKVASDPTAQGAIGGAIAAILAALGVVKARKKLRGEKNAREGP